MSWPTEHEIIRQKRIERGLSQGELGAQIGTGAQFISNVELGKAPLPARYFRDIAKVLDLDVQKLVNARLRVMKRELLIEAGLSGKGKNK